MAKTDLVHEAYRCWNYICGECSSAYVSRYIGIPNKKREQMVRLRRRAYLRLCRRWKKQQELDKI